MARKLASSIATGKRTAPKSAGPAKPVVLTRSGKNVNTGTRKSGVQWTREYGAMRKRFEEAARGAHVKIGVLASQGGGAKSIRKSKHVGERGTARNAVNKAFEVTDIFLVELAAIHEFGSPAAHIPERSFIRRTFDTKHTEIRALATKLAAKIVDGKMDIDKALTVLGQFCAAEVKKTITRDRIPPPLKPATIEAKGSNRPLVDTGRLLGAISYEVNSK